MKVTSEGREGSKPHLGQHQNFPHVQGQGSAPGDDYDLCSTRDGVCISTSVSSHEETDLVEKVQRYATRIASD